MLCLTMNSHTMNKAYTTHLVFLVIIMTSGSTGTVNIRGWFLVNEPILVVPVKLIIGPTHVICIECDYYSIEIHFQSLHSDCMDNFWSVVV